jgi:hypothetical protein
MMHASIQVIIESRPERIVRVADVRGLKHAVKQKDQVMYDMNQIRSCSLCYFHYFPPYSIPT